MTEHLGLKLHAYNNALDRCKKPYLMHGQPARSTWNESLVLAACALSTYPRRSQYAWRFPRNVDMACGLNKNRSDITPDPRASASAPLRTGADMCKTGSGAGKRSGAKSDPVRIPAYIVHYLVLPGAIERSQSPLGGIRDMAQSAGTCIRTVPSRTPCRLLVAAQRHPFRACDRDPGRNVNAAHACELESCDSTSIYVSR